jgi:hypothetical protein
MPYDEQFSTEHTDEMPDPTPVPVRGRTHWLRFLGTMGATGAVAALLVGLTAQGVLAADFSISGLPFTVTATNLDGTGFEQFATLDTMPDNSPNAGNTGGQIVVVVSAIQSAQLTNLCQSINLGGAFLKITAGDNGTPVSATTLVVDSDQISGDASFQNIAIGQDASTLNKVTGVTGNIGVFGQQADHVTIQNLRQDNFATTAASFTLPHLSITFSDTGC